MKIGETYLVPGPNGEVPAELTTASVNIERGEMMLAFYDHRNGQAWVSTAPMTAAELEDYRHSPETFFGVYLRQGGNCKTPLELFDWMHESYKDTPKEKLLEFMTGAPDLEELAKLSQKELSEICCERWVYGVLASQNIAAPAASSNTVSRPSG